MFKYFLGSINQWADGNMSVVQKVFVAPVEKGLRVFVMVRGSHFSFDITDSMTDLDLQLAKEFSAIPFDLVQIPSDPTNELSSFFSPEGAVQAYGG